MKKENIAVILVSPENPDNIGAVARAVKNMGFSDLRLVKPSRLKRRRKAKKMAVTRGIFLEKAVEYASLPFAKRSHGSRACYRDDATRGRASRELFFPFDQKRFPEIRGGSLSASKDRVSFLAVNPKGSTNEESALCDQSGDDPDRCRSYPSLNLAQAVMVMLFALSLGTRIRRKSTTNHERILNKKEIEVTIAHF